MKKILIRKFRLSFILYLICLFVMGNLTARADAYTVFGPELYKRGKGKPVTITNTFSVLNSNTNYFIKIRNGGLKNPFRKVSSARIWLNNELIVRPKDFRRKPRIIKKPVSLQGENKISVRITGKPSSKIAITILGVDDDPPMIKASVAPESNVDGWHNSDVTVSFDCTDAISGISSCPEPVIVSTEGAGQIVSGIALDHAGNTTTANVTINLDKTSPVVQITDPEADSFVEESPIAVSGTIEEINLQSLNINGLPASISNGSFSIVSFPLVEGENEINATATDLAGNTGSDTIIATLDTSPSDTTPPTFSILSPEEGETLTESRPDIEVSYSDDSGIDINSFNMTLNNDGSIDFECELGPMGGSCTPSAPLPEGQNLIEASIADTFGNRAGDQAAFIIDTTAPVIEITSPEDNDVLNNTSIEVVGTVDDNEAAVEVNGIPATIEGGIFRAAGVPLSEGINAITANVVDPAGNINTTSIQVILETLPPPNHSPVLGEIGDQTVILGRTLSFTVVANDPDGDELTFMVTPLPLPEYASFDSMTGQFVFAPREDQLGDYTLSFSVSDGADSDEETITITVEAPAPGTPSGVEGRLLDANAAASGEEIPIAGATISVLNTAFSTLSAEDGSFVLSGFPMTEVPVLDIDASTAILAPDGSKYANFREAFDLIEGTTNEIIRPIFLPRIDSQGTAMIESGQETVVNNPNINVILVIPPNTAMLNGAPYIGPISISEVPVDQAPVAMPDTFRPAMLITIQPTGVTFTQPLSITFPSLEEIEAGSEMQIASVDPETGQFIIVGTGRISDDEQRIETIDGGIRTASWHMAFPFPPLVRTTFEFDPTALSADGEVGASSENQNVNNCCDKETGSRTALETGNLNVEHKITTGRSFGSSQDLRLVYNSRSANPQPVIRSNTTLAIRAGTPGAISSDLFVGGVRAGDTAFTSSSTPSEPGDSLRFPSDPDNNTISQARSFDASDLETGSYPYSLAIRSRFTQRSFLSRLISFSGAAARGTTLINNESRSPFGAGWTIEGLERLRMQNGEAILTTGDGSISKFRMNILVDRSFSEPDFFFSSSESFGGWVDSEIIDIDNDGDLDIIGASSNSNRVEIILNDGSGDLNIIDFELIERPGVTPVSITTSFINDDFIFDLIVGYFGVGASSEEITTDIFLGNGDGTFGPRIILNQFSSQNIGTEDFDQDGNLDIVRITGLLGIQFGDGNGNFSDPDLNKYSPSAIGADTRGLTILDFDNNDYEDIAIVNYDGANQGDSVDIFFNDGSGFFTRETFSVPTGSTGNADGENTMTASDFDQDGALDLVFTDRDSQSIKFLWGDGTGGVDAISTLALDSEVFTIAAADMDKDGFIDIIVGNLVSNDYIVLAGSGTRDFEEVVRKTYRLSFFSNFPNNAGLDFAIADFDGNGFKDIIADSNAIFNDGPAIKSPSGDFSVLVENPDKSCTRILKSGVRIEYDEDGRIIERIEPDGVDTRYQYDGTGRLSQLIDPAGKQTTFAYSSGMLSAITDQVGRVTRFEHDESGNLTRIINPDLTNRRFNYDDRHCMILQISRRGFETTYEYDAFGRNIGANRPDGTSRQVEPAESKSLPKLSEGVGTLDNALAFRRPDKVSGRFVGGNGNEIIVRSDSLGSPTSITDAFGRLTTFERDKDSNPTRITLPDGSVNEFNYDNRGNALNLRQAAGETLERQFQFSYDNFTNQPTSITDPEGNKTEIFYTGGNPSLIRDADNTETQITYGDSNCQGEATRIVRALGLSENSETTFEYDPNSCNLKRIIDAEGDITEFDYDAAGNITEMREGVNVPASQSITTFAYDVMDRPLTVTDDEGNTVRFGYDTAGNVTHIESPTGEVQARTYDEMNRLTSIEDPITGLTIFEYDAQGNLIRTEDAEGAITQFFYDDVNRMIRSVDAEGGERQFEYDERDNLVSVTDANGKITRFEYDTLDRQTKRINPLNQIREFFYDSRNNLVRKIDQNGQETTFIYDSLSRLTTTTTPDNVIQIAYDALSRVTNITDNDSALSFTYDNLDRLITAATTAAGIQPEVTLTNNYDELGNRLSLTDSLGGVTHFEYDDLGQVTQVTTASGKIITLSYDDAGRSKNISFPGSVDSSFGYDLDGRLERLTHSTNLGASILEDLTYDYNKVGSITQIAELSKTRDFSYDLLQQLTSGGTAASSETYDYDMEGNRVTSHLSSLHVIDGVNRLLEDDVFTYTYDANGNLKTKTEKTTGDITTYTYDAQDQLIVVELPDSSTVSYAYDGLRRRIEKNVDGIKTRYIYDGEDIVLEFDGSNTLTAAYTHGPGRDQPLSIEIGGQDYFYQADHLGSIRLLTDENGFVVNEYTYDSFGRPLTVSETILQPYGFTGREFDPEIGLYFYRARNYDPFSGRFLQQDPIGFSSGDFNLYRYVFNNPIGLNDPSGEIAQLLGFFAVEFAIDVTVQLVENGFNVECVNLWQSVEAGVIGALFGPIGGKILSRIPVGKRPPPRRTFSSDDPHVADIANAIEAAYPGHVKGVNRVVKGQEVDIELGNAIIEVKGGNGKGLTRQVIDRANIGKPVIGHAPNLGPNAAKSINNAGGIASGGRQGTLQDLIEVVKP